MIIVGYPGVGKSSLAKAHYHDYIDLESSWFQTGAIENWWEVYCNVAEHLSENGHVVFVSCHECVRYYLALHSKQKVVVVYPSVKLKDQWIEKLRIRWEVTGADKDLRAYERAAAYFVGDILELSSCGLDRAPLDDMNYELGTLVFQLRMEEGLIVKRTRDENTD